MAEALNNIPQPQQDDLPELDTGELQEVAPESEAATVLNELLAPITDDILKQRIIKETDNDIFREMHKRLSGRKLRESIIKYINNRLTEAQKEAFARQFTQEHDTDREQHIADEIKKSEKNRQAKSMEEQRLRILAQEQEIAKGQDYRDKKFGKEKGFWGKLFGG